MGELVNLFGDKPRVKLIEALVELAPHKFTLPELAEQAGLDKNVYREVQPLINEGLLLESGGNRPKQYRVNMSRIPVQLADLFQVIAENVKPPLRSKRESKVFLEKLWKAMAMDDLGGVQVIFKTNRPEESTAQSSLMDANKANPPIPTQNKDETHVINLRTQDD